METWILEVDPWVLGIVVFFTQLLFIFSRTLNVIYTAEHRILGSLVTGTSVHLTWLLSISIGVKSVMYEDWLVVAFSLTGGLLGTYLGIWLKKKLK